MAIPFQSNKVGSLLSQPIQSIERYSSGAIEQNNPGREAEVSFEKSIGALLTWIVSIAILN